MSETWTIGAALSWTEGYLAKAGDASPRISAQWLIGAATGLSRIELYMHFEQPLNMNERAILRDSVRRRAQGEPLQYITGEVGFRHISLKVMEGVLIPRPETEVLVTQVLDYIERQNIGDSRIVDLCTGSGCIACSLIQELESTYIYATDIDERAVRLAEENATLLGLRDSIEILKGDLGEAVPSGLRGTLDVVCSNPPYIPSSLLANLPEEVVKHEPLCALDGGDDGLNLFRQIVPWAHFMLKPGGLLAVELHETCLDLAENIVCEQGFESAWIVNDLAQRPRVICAIMPK